MNTPLRQMHSQRQEERRNRDAACFVWYLVIGLLAYAAAWVLAHYVEIFTFLWNLPKG